VTEPGALRGLRSRGKDIQAVVSCLPGAQRRDGVGIEMSDELAVGESPFPDQALQRLERPQLLAPEAQTM
jgi:hypothetical protein